MKEVILKHTTTDGKTHHLVDLTIKKHIVESVDADGDSYTVNKKWGTQQKFVEKLIKKEIEKVKTRISVQKHTIGECKHYNRMSGIEITEKKLKLNEQKLHYLENYVYETTEKV
jgi:hypothetical protein